MGQRENLEELARDLDGVVAALNATQRAIADGQDASSLLARARHDVVNTQLALRLTAISSQSRGGVGIERG